MYWYYKILKKRIRKTEPYSNVQQLKPDRDVQRGPEKTFSWGPLEIFFGILLFKMAHFGVL